MFEHFEYAVESIAQLGVVPEIDGPAGVSVAARSGVAVGKEDVGGFLLVMSARPDVEGLEIRGAKKNRVNAERANG